MRRNLFRERGGWDREGFFAEGSRLEPMGPAQRAQGRTYMGAGMHPCRVPFCPTAIGYTKEMKDDTIARSLWHGVGGDLWTVLHGMAHETPGAPSGCRKRGDMSTIGKIRFALMAYKLFRRLCMVGYLTKPGAFDPYMLLIFLRLAPKKVHP